jgi:hypothetical protein
MNDKFINVLRQASGSLAVAANDIEAMYSTARQNLYAVKAIAAQKGVELDIEPFLAELHDPQFSIRGWNAEKDQLRALVLGLEMGSKLR